MPQDIDIHAMLLRAEAKAKEQLEDVRKANQSVGGIRWVELLAFREEAYATACAVRLNWEACERRASKENLSASSYAPQMCGHVTGTACCTFLAGHGGPHRVDP